MARAILDGMTRRLHNWNYKDVTTFLKQNGFSFYREVSGSHQAWIKYGEDGTPDRIVGLHFTSREYHVGTMKRVVKESGITENAWVKWANS